jgi:hypothetical protein
MRNVCVCVCVWGEKAGGLFTNLNLPRYPYRPARPCISWERQELHTSKSKLALHREEADVVVPGDESRSCSHESYAVSLTIVAV